MQATDFNWGGFGSVGLACSDSNDVDFAVNTQPKGPGRTSRCDTGLDSLLGVQFDWQLNAQFELGLQLIAERQYDASFTPEISVGQLRWHPSRNLTVRLGRMPTPIFLHSENRQVHFTMPWIRPPQEVYGLIPSTDHDGLELLLGGQLGRWQTELQTGISAFSFDVPVSNSPEIFTVDSKNAYVNYQLRQNGLLLKLGAFVGEADIDVYTNQVFDSLKSMGGSAGKLGNELEINPRSFYHLSAGMEYETANWMVTAEMAYRSTGGFIRDQFGAYVTVGHRIESWTPYVTLARRSSHGPTTDARAGFLTPEIEFIYNASTNDSTRLALGLSKELAETIKLKFQIDYIKPDDDSLGIFFNHGSNYDFANPDAAWIAALSIDFVF